MGLEVVRAADGVAEVLLELTPRHRNRRGVAHGVWTIWPSHPDEAGSAR